jgi:hypothetical protein
MTEAIKDSQGYIILLFLLKYLLEEEKNKMEKGKGGERI